MKPMLLADFPMILSLLVHLIRGGEFQKLYKDFQRRSSFASYMRRRRMSAERVLSDKSDRTFKHILGMEAVVALSCNHWRSLEWVFRPELSRCPLASLRF